MLSAPATRGVKLSVVANAEPPVNVGAHEPVVAIAAVALALVPAVKFTCGAGLPVHEVSLRRVVTALSVGEGFTAVPAGDAGAVTLPSVICASVSAPLLLMRFE